MELSDPTVRVILPLKVGRKSIELPFESRQEARALIAAVARDVIPRLPADGEPDELADQGGVPFALAGPELTPEQQRVKDEAYTFPCECRAKRWIHVEPEPGVTEDTCGKCGRAWIWTEAGAQLKPEPADDPDTDDMGDDPTDYGPVQEPPMCQADGHGARCMRLEGHSGPHRSRGSAGDIEWVSDEKHPTVTMSVAEKCMSRFALGSFTADGRPQYTSCARERGHDGDHRDDGDWEWPDGEAMPGDVPEPGRGCPAMATDGNICTGHDGHLLPHRTAAGYEWGGGLDWDDPADTGERSAPGLDGDDGETCPRFNKGGAPCVRHPGHPGDHRTRGGGAWATGGPLDGGSILAAAADDSYDDGPEPYGPADGPECGEPTGSWPQKHCNAQKGHGGDHGVYADNGTLMITWAKTPAVIPLRDRVVKSAGAPSPLELVQSSAAAWPNGAAK